MAPTDYHPVRTAMMRNLRDRCMRFAGIDPEEASGSMPRPSNEWNPRFFSYEASMAVADDHLFRWRGAIVREQMRGLSEALCVGAMNRLCVFEDMLASIREAGRPIIDISTNFDAIRNDPSFSAAAPVEIGPEHLGSFYVHFGDTGVKAIGDRSVTGVYAHSRRHPDGTIYGDLHFAGPDPNWGRAHEIGFYETLLTHQDVSVVTYQLDRDGTIEFRMHENDIVFGNEHNAYQLVPFAKLGMDIALGKARGFDCEVRREFIHGGRDLGAGYRTVDIMAASPCLAPSWESNGAFSPGRPN